MNTFNQRIEAFCRTLLVVVLLINASGAPGVKAVQPKPPAAASIQPVKPSADTQSAKQRPVFNRPEAIPAARPEAQGAPRTESLQVEKLKTSTPTSTPTQPAATPPDER